MYPVDKAEAVDKTEVRYPVDKAEAVDKIEVRDLKQQNTAVSDSSGGSYHELKAF